MALEGEIVVERCSRSRAMVRGRQTVVWGDWLPWRATVNPVPGDVLATLQEGERLGRQYRALSDDVRLTATDDELGVLGDLVRYEGQVFEVRDVQTYPTVIPHQEYRIRRLLPGST